MIAPGTDGGTSSRPDGARAEPVAPAGLTADPQRHPEGRTRRSALHSLMGTPSADPSARATIGRPTARIAGAHMTEPEPRPRRPPDRSGRRGGPGGLARGEDRVAARDRAHPQRLRAARARAGHGRDRRVDRRPAPPRRGDRGRGHRDRPATRSSTAGSTRRPARRRCSSTATTTCSPSTRSTCGSTRRSSRSSATAGSSGAASPTTRASSSCTSPRSRRCARSGGRPR